MSQIRTKILAQFNFSVLYFLMILFTTLLMILFKLNIMSLNQSRARLGLDWIYPWTGQMGLIEAHGSHWAQEERVDRKILHKFQNI